MPDYLKMMEEIAWETHFDTTCFKIQNKASPRPQILDMGMAPGGFLSIALKHNREAQAFGFSLPVSDGGYEILVKKRPDVVIKELDVTMLAADLGIDDMPEESPDGRPFLSRQFAPGQRFDLVICGCSIVRDHPVLIVREGCRLRASQLALGLQRLSSGGKMVVLFHKLEAWDTLLDLYRFSRFSDKVQLCKPETGTGHDKRSSFYMVATGVRSDKLEALDAIESWKDLWKAATLDIDGKLMKEVRDEEPAVQTVLGGFGDKLKDMIRKVWSTQAKALKEALVINSIKK
ncbi:hypothetical protein CMUS01_11003 [Colletotrichum musicola]|uniref:Ribosomal RNA methyltransferase FtsJ domain-containing protein n=1 Tax=Colletotrichum musicola TaxID=2175873 RepID=A0A8H6K0V0_9PEZI|nr:hypothetical protein CMUS01_11003 [Colletotrichum musicola]